MAAEEQQDELPPRKWGFWPHRKRWRLAILLAFVLLAGSTYGWVQREEIADDLIGQQIEASGLRVSYQLGTIAADRQTLRNVVVGDPDAPDLTIDEVEVNVGFSFFEPSLGQIKLVRPRLYGTYRDSKLSFGELDSLLFTGSEEPFALPEYDVRLVDARAQMATDFGDIGIKAEGAGPLNDGFAGVLAIAAPDLTMADCALKDATLFGDVQVDDGKPRFDGPLRWEKLACPQLALALDNWDMALGLEMAADAASIDARTSLTGKALRYADMRANAVSGDFRMGWNGELTNVDYNLSSGQVSGQGWQLSDFGADGGARIAGAFDRSELDGEITAANLAMASGVAGGLADFQNQTEGTLAHPLIFKLRRGIDRLERANSLSAQVMLRQTGPQFSGAVPVARLADGSGQTALGVSRLQFAGGGSAGVTLSGNIATQGVDLPQITGRMERQAGGSLAFSMKMAEFAEGRSSIAVPAITIAQSGSGALRFEGLAVASGAFPGGDVRGLDIPISGNWSPSGGLAMWRECVSLGYESLSLSNLQLDPRPIRLCPKGGGAILASGQGGIRMGAEMRDIDLRGDLGSSPFALSGQSVALSWPGVIQAENVAISLGEGDSANRFALAELSANLDGNINGSFSGGEVLLGPVPMDIGEASGELEFSDGVLRLSSAQFSVSDREAEPRFEPLIARDAEFSLEDNVVLARAALRNPDSDRVISAVDILHDLNDSSGHADLSVDNLRFDDDLQPDQLTQLARGVVALVDGSVNGTGRIDWSEQGISSSGEFSTASLDLAAAFGPVTGANGTIRFVDLISLTTAPNQQINLTAINPGIEVLAGKVTYEIRNGQTIDIKGGEWPFMGGSLIMRPVTLDFSRAEKRRYVFELVALDAGAFVSQMEFNNLSASGIFDGTVPIVFDEIGNGRIEQSTLTARAPGGNVSYVGALTYEDMGVIANFAFNALRSLDFEQMEIQIDGSLTGDLVTNVEIDGVQQGAGASQNFLTREIAKLPIQLNVNVRAPFYQMMTSLRSLYDPQYVDDPRSRGLLPDEETPPDQLGMTEPLAIPREIAKEKLTIQLEESETMP